MARSGPEGGSGSPAGTPPAWAALPPRTRAPGPIGHGSVFQSAAPPPARWHQTWRQLAATLCSPERKCRAWPRAGRGRGSRRGLHLAFSSPGRRWALFLPGARSSHPPNGPPHSKGKSGRTSPGEEGSGARSQPGGEGGSQSPGTGLGGVQRGSGSPLGHSEQEGSLMPGDHRVPVEGGHRATAALPSVLCQWGRPSPFHPGEVPEKPERGGRAPGNLPEASSTCAHWPPPKTDSSVTPGG